jgi:hypothetical protein
MWAVSLKNPRSGEREYSGNFTSAESDLYLETGEENIKTRL